jgi:hypothetical protein
VPGVPRGTYVSRVEASRAGEGAAYVAFDGHRGDDYTPYVFRTEDFGQTWRPLAANLPRGATVSVVREHPRSPNLLFVGTETALWASFDRGGSWQRLKGNLPTVPVDDIQVHPRDNDLILATHGRGIFILDDIGLLEKAAGPAEAAELRVFPIRPAVQYRIYNHKGNTGHKAFLGPNPPDGALITYQLKSKPGEKDEVKVVVKDGAGAVVRELKGGKQVVGLNRVNWDLRHEPPVKPDPTLGPGGGFFGPPRGPLVPPGAYTVGVSIGTISATQTVDVQEDPRIQSSATDRLAWYEASREAARLWGRADAANKAAESLKKQLTTLQESLEKRDDKPAAVVISAVKALAEKVDGLARRFSRQTPLGFAGAPLSEDPDPLVARARGLYLAVSSITAAPTAQQKDMLPRTARELDAAAAALNEVIEKDMPALNRLLVDHGLGRLEATKVP